MTKKASTLVMMAIAATFFVSLPAMGTGSGMILVPEAKVRGALAPHGFQELRPSILAYVTPSATYGLPAQCTGAMISNSGHILTALHCIQRCLEDNSSALTERSRRYPRNEIHSALGLISVEIDSGKVQGTRCEINLNGIPTTAYVVATGHRYMFAQHLALVVAEGAWDILTDLTRDGLSGSEDFAIIRVQKVSNSGCLRVSKSEPQKSDKLWSIGFPIKQKSNTNAIEATFEPTNGIDRYFSSGHITAGLDENQCFTERFSHSQIELAKYREFFNDERLFASTMASRPGFSGGPAIGENGAVVGLNVQVISFSNDTAPLCSGYARSIKVSQIMRSLNEQGYSKAQVGQFFDCN